MTRFLRLASALLLGGFVPGALAFGINVPPFEVQVVEYRNAILDHYFLTANRDEMAVIEGGGAGPGWTATGRAFRAYGYVDSDCNCTYVARFHGTPGLGPNSHFYTENREEAAILQRPGSGWTLESSQAFASVLPVAGSCPAAAPVPVRRFYNNRWMSNDSNHRYVTRESDRAAMVAAGWADEGIHFCTMGEVETALKTYSINAPLEGNILPSAECEDESLRVGPCIAINNLPVPRTSIRIVDFPTADFARFVNLTSVYSETAYVPWLGGAETADGPFLQGPAGTTTGAQVDTRYGIHVDTRGKGVTQSSGINPLYQFRTRPEDGDARFFPWRGDPAAQTELSIYSVVQLMKAVARTPGSHYQGHPTLEFIDTRSGRHLYFTVGVFAPNLELDGDYLAPDVGTGKVIVGTTHRASTPYGRSLRSNSICTPYDFVGNFGGIFDFRMDRIEFGRVLAAARRVDPALSSDPDDYLLDNFHFNNEVGGDGEIGLNVSLSLRVMQR